MSFKWNLRTKRDFGGNVWVSLSDLEVFALKMANDGASEEVMRVLDHLIDAANRVERARRG